MRILGIDYGTRRVGLALSDETGIVAQSLETLSHTGSMEVLLRKIQEIVQRHGVGECVVGLPLNMNGTRGEKAKEAEAFAEELKSFIHLPVHLWDERLTTASVEKELSRFGVGSPRRKKLVDRIAAQLILQNYLDCQRSRSAS